MFCGGRSARGQPSSPLLNTHHHNNTTTHNNNTTKPKARVDALYKDQDEWTRRSILYTASSGKFSSDRTIVEYAKDIWHVSPCKPPAAA